MPWHEGHFAAGKFSCGGGAAMDDLRVYRICLMTARIADDEERCRAVDRLPRRCASSALPKLWSICLLRISSSNMKRTRYAKDRTGKYRLYYIVR